jgi:hypothetical protein
MVTSGYTNNNGFVQYGFNGSGKNLWMDLRPYLTYAQTNDGNIPALVSTLGQLLVGTA